MKYTGFLFCLLITSSVFSQGIEFFHGTWEEAVGEAEKTEKLLFVDAYAQWCGPCKRMAKEVFTQAEVGDFFNSNFINLKLDMETPDGRSFGSKFPVSAYPTLFFLNGDGEIVKKVTGGKQAADLIALGKTAIKSYDRSGDYAVKYEEGDRSYELVHNYVKELNKVGKPSLKISNEYISSNPPISKSEKAAFLYTAVVDSDSKLFDQMISMKNEVIQATSEDSYKDKVKNACFATIAKAVEFDYEDLMHEAIEKYKAADAGDAKKFTQEAKLEYHKLAGNYTEWKTLAEKYMKKYGKKDHDVFKQHLLALKGDFSHEKDAKPYACDVCKEMVKRDDSPDNYSEYIQLLLDCRNYDEARKVTNKAIEIANSRELDTKKFERIIKYLDNI